jgi:hypothetical protein
MVENTELNPFSPAGIVGSYPGGAGYPTPPAPTVMGYVPTVKGNPVAVL